MLEEAPLWVICSPPALPKHAYHVVSLNLAHQAQHKWLVLPQCIWGSETPLHCVTHNLVHEAVLEFRSVIWLDAIVKLIMIGYRCNRLDE